MKTPITADLNPFETEYFILALQRHWSLIHVFSVYPCIETLCIV